MAVEWIPEFWSPGKLFLLVFQKLIPFVNLLNPGYECKIFIFHDLPKVLVTLMSAKIRSWSNFSTLKENGGICCFVVYAVIIIGRKLFHWLCMKRLSSVYSLGNKHSNRHNNTIYILVYFLIFIKNSKSIGCLL